MIFLTAKSGRQRRILDTLSAPHIKYFLSFFHSSAPQCCTWIHFKTSKSFWGCIKLFLWQKILMFKKHTSIAVNLIQVHLECYSVPMHVAGFKTHTQKWIFSRGHPPSVTIVVEVWFSKEKILRLNCLLLVGSNTQHLSPTQKGEEVCCAKDESINLLYWHFFTLLSGAGN